MFSAHSALPGKADQPSVLISHRATRRQPRSGSCSLQVASRQRGFVGTERGRSRKQGVQQLPFAAFLSAHLETLEAGDTLLGLMESSD